ncbi:OVARIAN TUMOR DOMAIN-containing deubiquitinating enzyme 4 isoform X2 [Eucalyptus grandis]|uniref:OVARIAN TUMOR DOMAIN-containing deubiquitinating enzyme 4 isoform X2 n=1 Tax=Eucalyptus grandis TaxID=71139 RepID=UPI000527152A|nr:OVARIAN TUMOR DOMAIN-containing deubiquitinating enzyme 4 isoform X2 [Eucalyptus grandis]
MRTVSSRTMPKAENSRGNDLAQFRTIRIAGDGRCLFRSVIHGAYLGAGKQSPCESHQKQLADELRAKVADEFVKRRAEIERFLEDDFDTYVAEMRQPHQWGGEPELLMCSHVLQTPITVYMKERFSSSLRIIAEYGREYGTGNPINVLYHSYGHYDALLPPNGNGQYKMSNKR